MTLTAQFRNFKEDLLGYVEVTFGEFREIAPLRQKRTVWSAEESERVRRLAGKGAGYALQRFFGTKHQAAVAVLGAAELHPEPMTRTELDLHMKQLVRSCLTDGWPASRFLAFSAYLDSDMTPKELVAQDRERRLQSLASGGSLLQQARAGTGPAEEKDTWDVGEAPDRDHFAEKYRSAGPLFKQAVKEHFRRAAIAAGDLK